jgi:ABC-type maltose transport system permease subunit
VPLATRRGRDALLDALPRDPALHVHRNRTVWKNHVSLRRNAHTVQFGGKSVICALPTALIYILLGRFFVRGLLDGSVKE